MQEYIPNRTGDVVTNQFHQSDYERGYDEGFRDGVKSEREHQRSIAESKIKTSQETGK